MSNDTRAEATAALRALVGREDAVFHDGQFEAIHALVDQRRRALVVQRTGWGKSAVYFVATALLRARGAGPTLLVSPLLALMRDQVAAAERSGVRAVAINSTNAHEWRDVQSSLAADQVDVLLVSPERLNNPGFREQQLPDLIARTGLLVVDEAHCISDWGHDFRPDYRRLRQLVAELDPSVPVLATTATANTRVVADIAEQLHTDAAEVLTIRGPLARQSLRLGVLTLSSDVDRLAWLMSHLPELPGSGIVYTLTVAAASDTARALRSAGVDAVAYSGQTPPEERAELEDRLRTNRIKVLVATSALGMGFDKPDLGFVVHMGAPSSPVAYYQQVGRAGRATDRADVLLLPGAEDQAVWEYFATASMPQQELAERVIAALGESPLSTQALETRVNLRRSKLELLLKVLDVDGVVRRVAGGWIRTGKTWTYDAERYERIAASRVREQNAMLEYERTEQCRMVFLQQALDDTSAVPCGKCDRCAGAWYPTDVSPAAHLSARTAVAGAGAVIEPRAQWPSGMKSLDIPVAGKIPRAQRMAEGRALARLTDLGWGGPLRAMFASEASDAPVPAPMLQAAAKVLGEWEWQARPVAVVSVPSSRHPELVRSLAEGLAALGKLPYLGALRSSAVQTPQQGNSAFRLAEVWNTLHADHLQIPAGPVLLLDDIADSRWTLQVAAQALSEAGASQVLPFTLALRA